MPRVACPHSPQIEPLYDRAQDRFNPPAFLGEPARSGAAFMLGRFERGQQSDGMLLQLSPQAGAPIIPVTQQPAGGVGREFGHPRDVVYMGRGQFHAHDDSRPGYTQVYLICWKGASSTDGAIIYAHSLTSLDFVSGNQNIPMFFRQYPFHFNRSASDFKI